MKRILLPLLLVGFTANAADWYVHQGATGGGHGTSWTAAWSEMNQVDWSTVACGDTVWLAAGSYTTALKGSKSCTAGAPLTFKRVLSTDSVPTQAAGWSAAYDGLVVLPNISVPGPAAYVTFDGRLPYGIQIAIPGTEGEGIDASNNGDGGPAVDHLTWANIEIVGPDCVTSGTCTGGGVVGVQVAPYCSTANRTNLLFDHLSVHRTGEAFRACGWSGGFVQNSVIYDTHNDGQQHEDIQYTNPPYENVTWRDNQIFMSPNDGIFFEYAGGAVNWAFYGNRVYHSGGELIVFKVENDGSYGPVFIYNNVFENDGTFGDYQPGWLDFTGPMANGSVVANNVFENITITGTAPGADYNAYSTGEGKQDNGAHSFTYNPGTLGQSVLFVSESPSNPLAADFHLTSTGASVLQNGLALSAPYDVDPDGNPRGAGGHWTIGAYQTCDGGCAGPADAGVSRDGGVTSDGGVMTDAGTDAGTVDNGTASQAVNGCGCSQRGSAAEALPLGILVLGLLRFAMGRKARRSA